MEIRNPDAEAQAAADAEEFNRTVAAEAAAFARERGIIPVGERMNEIVAELPEEEKVRYLQYSETLRPLQESLSAVPEILRLHELRQLGGKTAPAKAGELGPFALEPVIHSRFDHSELLASLVLLAASRIGVPVEKAKASVAAAWLHDSGHSAFSHIGDELLLSRGYPDHEERSIALLQNSLEIREVFAREGVDAEEVAELIREQGPYGTIQSMADTLSYLVFDSHAVGAPAYPDHGREVIEDIRGIDAARSELIVGHEKPWQEMLEVRAQMMKHVYYHPKNKAAEAALQQLLRRALEGGYIQPEEIERGTDMPLHFKLQSLIQRDENAAIMAGRINPDGSPDAEPHLAEYRDLFDFTMGFVPEGWDRQVFDSLSTAESFLSHKDASAIRKSLIVKPFDYTKKKLRLLVEDSKDRKNPPREAVLRSKTVSLRPEDAGFVVYCPKERA